MYLGTVALVAANVHVLHVTLHHAYIVNLLRSGTIRYCMLLLTYMTACT